MKRTLHAEWLAFWPMVALSLLAPSIAFAAADTASPSSGPASVMPASPPTQRAAIESAYTEINSAFSANRIPEIMAMLMPSYTQTDPKGHVLDRTQSCNKLQDERNSIRTISTQFQITGIAPSPEGLLVNMRMHCAGTDQKRVLFIKVNGTFTNDTVVRDLWVSTPAGWRIQTRQTLLDQSHTHAA